MILAKSQTGFNVLIHAAVISADVVVLYEKSGVAPLVK